MNENIKLIKPLPKELSFIHSQENNGLADHDNGFQDRISLFWDNGDDEMGKYWGNLKEAIEDNDDFVITWFPTMQTIDIIKKAIVLQIDENPFDDMINAILPCFESGDLDDIITQEVDDNETFYHIHIPFQLIKDLIKSV